MKTSKVKIWLDNAEWLKKIPALNTPEQSYYANTLKYIARSYFEPGEEANLKPHEYRLTVGHSGEEIIHATIVHLFFHSPDRSRYFWDSPADKRDVLEPDETLEQAMAQFMAGGLVVDAIVIQVRITSSRLGVIADSFDVVIPEGSSLDKRAIS